MGCASDDVQHILDKCSTHVQHVLKTRPANMSNIKSNRFTSVRAPGPDFRPHSEAQGPLQG